MVGSDADRARTGRSQKRRICRRRGPPQLRAGTGAEPTRPAGLAQRYGVDAT